MCEKNNITSQKTTPNLRSSEKNEKNLILKKKKKNIKKKMQQPNKIWEKRE